MRPVTDSAAIAAFGMQAFTLSCNLGRNSSEQLYGEGDKYPLSQSVGERDVVHK